MRRQNKQGGYIAEVALAAILMIAIIVLVGLIVTKPKHTSSVEQTFINPRN